MMNEKYMVDIFLASTPTEETNMEPHNYITKSLHFSESQMLF